MKKLFTSESVTEGHPDKIADQISDAVVDAVLAKDPNGRVACETLVTNGMCVVAGEMTTTCYVDIPKIAREVIRDIGYTDPAYGFHWETCGIAVAIHGQSPDIARGITRSTYSDATMGAGDQGLVFGYACRETPELMPLPIVLSQWLCERLAYVRKKGIIKGLRPDGKSQVTVAYDNGKPVRVHTVLLAAQHNPEWNTGTLRAAIEKYVIRPVLFDPKLRVRGLTWQKETLRRWKDLKIIVNGTGRFVIGGPEGDTGLTGRKIIVDTYGGMARHGGGCMSGKDPTKVDRSGSYAARWVAKTIVAARLARACEVQISYAIGIPKPLSVRVDTFGTGRASDTRIAWAIRKVFDLRPGMIIQALKLRRPIYRKVAAYGHFGRPELRLPWESTTRAAALRKIVGDER